MKKILHAILTLALVAVLAAPADATRRRGGPDEITRATPQISSEQTAIHDGRGYSMSGIRYGLAAGSIHWASIGTATDGIHIHALDGWVSSGYGIFLITENPDIIGIASATTLLPINRNRESTNESGVTVYNNVDVTPALSGYAITGAATATNIITITGAATETIEVGDAIVIDGSTGNDGFYYVFNATFATPTTTLTLNGIDDATADGDVYPLGVMLEMSTINAVSATSLHDNNNDMEFALSGDSVYLVGLWNATGSTPLDVAVWSFWTEDE